MNKFEWRKQCKDLYLPKNKPVKIDIPAMCYFTIEGSGNPNSEKFNEAIESLYSLSYAIRMMPKKGITPEGYYEYTVFPLEGFWDLDKEGRTLDYLSKDNLVYKLMIRQPEFVTNELLDYAVKSVKSKKPNLLCLDKVKFEIIEEGLCVQAMHLGSYDDEPQTFNLMQQFCVENNLNRLEKTHKEIYISDARKTTPDKLKTVLRFKVKQS
ncbi:GyrI-like domain-containing protein [Clostridium ganghwense]|uniref:GyrI-like domain-containing protein n=1 Tax=Clostridium ganghwense TaxID=312089 RepID=A0ABT4CU46_9CLOT|nr:GyrI-like domain-containing protein [Clostridium ganghwense]MCY6371489.1 GyrI-like domain-containing protein [Clostridium ganghwense]